MGLYLVQHGEARPASEDPERPLSAAGIANVRTMAAYAARLPVDVAEIWHSDKRRAIETAVVFAEALGVRAVEWSGLAPNDDVAPLAEDLAARTESLLIVGHLPQLSRLASKLLAGVEEPTVVGFRNAGIVRLDRQEDGRFLLRWSLPPEVVL